MMIRISKHVHVTFVLSLLALGLIGLYVAGRQDTPAAGTVSAAADQDEPRVLRVTGEGEVAAKPDAAYVNLTVETHAATVRQAQEQNASRMNKVLAALYAAGIPKEAVQTTSVYLYPEYGETKSGPPQVVGYVAGNQVRVTVTALDRLGPAIDTAVAAGANRVDGVSFGLKNTAALYREALAKAVADGRGRAEAIAKAGGLALVGIRVIAESGAPSPLPLLERPALKMEAASTPVIPGDLNVHAQVSIEYLVR